MKASHRKDVILARLVFAVFILAIVAVIYTVGAKLISNHKQQSEEVAQIESSEAQVAAESWKIPELQTEDTEAAVTETSTMVTTSSVNLRSEASKDSDSLGKLSAGTTVTILAVGEDGWDQVDYDGTTGYIKAEYLTQGETAAATASKVKTTAEVNMRSGPSKDNKKLATVPKGTELEASGEDGDWTKVTYDGQEGYIKSEYLKTVE